MPKMHFNGWPLRFRRQSWYNSARNLYGQAETKLRTLVSRIGDIATIAYDAIKHGWNYNDAAAKPNRVIFRADMRLYDIELEELADMLRELRAVYEKRHTSEETIRLDQVAFPPNAFGAIMPKQMKRPANVNDALASVDAAVKRIETAFSSLESFFQESERVLTPSDPVPPVQVVPNIPRRRTDRDKSLEVLLNNLAPEFLRRLESTTWPFRRTAGTTAPVPLGARLNTDDKKVPVFQADLDLNRYLLIEPRFLNAGRRHISYRVHSVASVLNTMDEPVHTYGTYETFEQAAAVAQEFYRRKVTGGGQTTASWVTGWARDATTHGKLQAVPDSILAAVCMLPSSETVR